MVNTEWKLVIALIIIFLLALPCNTTIHGGNIKNRGSELEVNIVNNITTPYTLTIRMNNETLWKIEVSKPLRIVKILKLKELNITTIELEVEWKNIKRIIKQQYIKPSRLFIQVMSIETQNYILIIYSINTKERQVIKLVNITIIPNPIGLGIGLIEVTIYGNVAVTRNTSIHVDKLGPFGGSLDYYANIKTCDNSINIMLELTTYPVVKYNDTIALSIRSSNYTIDGILYLKQYKVSGNTLTKTHSTVITVNHTIMEPRILTHNTRKEMLNIMDIAEYLLLASIIVMLVVLHKFHRR